jgi:hypothetical protein
VDKNPATNRSLSPVPARTPAAMPLPCRSTGRCSARPSTSVIWRPSPPLSTTPAEHQWRSESGLILSVSMWNTVIHHNHLGAERAMLPDDLPGFVRDLVKTVGWGFE